MKAASYQSLALAWQPKSKRDKPFILFSFFILVLFLGTALFLSSVEIPKEERREKVKVPDRVAKFILDKPKPIIKPKPKPKKVEKPKSKPAPKPKVKREKPKQEIKLTEKQKVARKKAGESGLLALSDELSDLMDTSSIDSMVGNAVRKPSNQTQIIATVDTDILTAGSQESSRTKRYRSIKQEEHLSKIVSTTMLDNEQGSMAKNLIAARAGDDVSNPEKKKLEKRARVGNYRSEEDIAYVVDKNKGKLHAIYRRMRRSDPGIQGKIVLEITILPSGKVENVQIVSSELQNIKLETRIIARVKQFDFGAQNVKKVTVTYPIEFLPS